MKAFNYSAIPFVRLLIPLLAGRVLSLYCSITPYFYGVVGIVCVLFVAFLCRPVRFSYAGRRMVGVGISLALLALGLINQAHYYFDSSLFEQNRIYQGVVKQVIKEKEGRQSVVLTVTQTDSTLLCYFNALMYLKNVGEDDLSPGDRILFESTLSELKYTGNPFAFEYADYMKNKGVQGQFFVERKGLIRLGRSFSVNRFFYQTRKNVEKKLALLPLTEEELAIVSALVLGDKSMLDDHTKANFSSAGAIHVLSISGLHVGIIFLMLMTFMGAFGKGTIAFIKVLFVIGVLWFYAALSGMSPSVTRATLMFSVFVISKYKSRRYNIYHSMAIAAFIILILHPYAVIHPGFWLSFLAVGSIVYFYPIINSWFYFSSPWGKYIWALISVSLSAQIGTLPLSLYLFGFFPTWFILSNLLIIPILPLLLISTLGLIVFPAESIMVPLMSDTIAAMFRYLNQVAAWVGSLPYARYAGVQLVFYQVLVFYGMLVFYIMWRQLKRGTYLVISLLFLWLAVVGLTVTRFKRYQQKVFAVHQISGKSAITLTSVQECRCWLNRPLETKEIDYVLQPLVLHQQAKALHYHMMDSLLVSPISLGNRRILIVNGVVDIEQFKDSIDIIVFTSKLKSQQIKNLIAKMKTQTLIFDSSFSYGQSRYLQNELKDCFLKLHFVSLDGAYVISI